MAHGFGYLVAIIDWYSRFVLSWRLSNSMDTSFCLEALDDALERHGQPAIFNTDQGAQFTSDAVREQETMPQLSKRYGVHANQIYKWKSQLIDNVFVERLWRSLKYEEVFLHAYEDLHEARTGIGGYMNYFNSTRPHQALGYQTPEAFYRGLFHKAA